MAVSTPRTLILGASTGLGRAVADICLAQGEQTIEVSLKPPQAQHENQQVIACDLADEQHVRALLADLTDQGHLYQRFFWVAGTLWRGYFHDQSADELAQIIDVNVRNASLIALWAWQQLAANELPSTYTVVSSASGVRGYDDFLKYTRQVSYVTTKYAQVGLTRALAAENTHANVRFSLFLPDGMNTPMRRHFKPEENQNLLDPVVVAQFMWDTISQQATPFVEKYIAKGSLDGYRSPTAAAE